jgi:diguanylate cyclase (GGDEF)-like protein
MSSPIPFRPAPSDSRTRRRHADGTRGAGALFAAAGTLSIVNAWLPGVCPPELKPTFTLLGLLDLLAALAVMTLPWDRWRPRALLAVPLLALVLTDAFAIAGGLDPWIPALMVLCTGVWAGVSLPRWSVLLLSPAFATAYVMPLLLAGRGAYAAATASVVVVLVVVIGEGVAAVVAGLRSANRRLAEASLRDDLTGVGNRRLAMESLERLRRGDAVLLLDVDHFKQINDHHGHARGDAVLAALGRQLRESVRGADAIARLGGEEFVVLLREAGADGWRVAERILADWRATGPPTTLSIGVAVLGPGESPHETLARADRALYDAKHRGRDRARLAAAAA